MSGHTMDWQLQSWKLSARQSGQRISEATRDEVDIDIFISYPRIR
jgi:hypothetical protein